MKLRVTSIQRGCVYDGPGIRTTVFLKGCLLHCPWCCNPETISYEQEYFVDDSKCVHFNGRTSVLCDKCERLGGKTSIGDCPFGVSEPVSKDYSSEELFEIISKDFDLMKSSGGGVTFSGGEPLLQSEALEPLLIALHKECVNIAFESTLVVPKTSFQRVLPYTQLFIIDLKLQQESLVPKSYLSNLKEMFTELRELRINTTFRLVVVPSFKDNCLGALSVLKGFGIKKIELLKCHNLGRNKYDRMGFINKDYTCSQQVFDFIAVQIKRFDIEISKLSI